MALLRIPLRMNAGSPEVIYSYIADAENERPAVATVGEDCFCKETKKTYTCTVANPATWEQTGGTGGAGGSRFPQTIAFGAYLVLTNVGAAYDTIAQAKGLGLAVIDFTGVSSIDFRVFINKVGTGTQSWQLYNVTDAAQIGVIDDAGSAGDKTLNATISSGLPTGVKVVRIRAKSSVAGDDPVYYGGTVKLA